MRVRAVVILLASLAALSGCAGDPASAGDGGTTPSPTPTPTPGAPSDPRGLLAARGAAAEDRRYTATYTLTSAGRPARTITVTVATDGSWRVDVPGGAMSGTVDIAIARTGNGLFQCALAPTPSCVRVAAPDGAVPAHADPRVEHLFTDWLGVLTDRAAAVSVARAVLPGARGDCFSVEPNSASLVAPVDPGIYCYDTDGTLTAAKFRFGTITLATVGAAPPSVTLPGPVVAAAPLPTKAPAGASSASRP
ncbi:MAG TPA: hypothetical protein VF054_14395 [Micromonosporaceae bacterium]